MNLDLVVAGNLAEDKIFGESYYGGSAGNIALNAQAVGLNTGIISNYGEDDFSHRYLSHLKDEGVDISLLRQDLKTLARCVVSSSANHSSSKEWFDNGTSEALAHFQLDEHQAQSVASSRYLHLTTTPASLALNLSHIKRKDGGIIGYEPGPRIGDDESYFDEEVFRRSDILFVNEEELCILDEQFGVNSLRKTMRHDQSIIATKGRDGVDVIRKAGRQHFASRSIPEELVLDSNGAGDAFKSGFYLGLSKTDNLEIAVKYGATLGAYIIQKYGALFEAEDMRVVQNKLNAL